MVSRADSNRSAATHDEFVRDPLADPRAVLAARQRPMAERLELAISWNKVASELQEGMKVASEPPRS